MTANTWDSTREVYSPSEVENVLLALGINVREETANDFLSFCPYHGNSDTPAFSTSKRYGYSVCFNPACAVGTVEPLTLEKMVRQLKHVTHIAAKRFIMQHKGEAGSFKEKFDSLQVVHEELPLFPIEQIDKMHERFWATEAATAYMKGRGFVRQTMEDFKVGFTPASRFDETQLYSVSKPDMVVVPAFDHKSRPVGLVGRSIVGKEFKNFGAGDHGRGFHKSKILWNLNNARRYETVIVCESTFDAMRIHQAGYPNVVAVLGGTLSQAQIDLFNRHFSRVIIFTDNESDENGNVIYHVRCAKCLRAGNDMCQGHKPGRELGMKIVESLPRLRHDWATYDDKHIYANDVKDASDMSDDEIRQCLKNKVSHFEYLDWTS